MNTRYGPFDALYDSLLNLIEGRPAACLRPERFRRPFPAAMQHVDPEAVCLRIPGETGSLSSDWVSKLYNNPTRITRGIDVALKKCEPEQVVELLVYAEDFRSFAREQGSNYAACTTLKLQLPKLEVLHLEDDYLTAFEIGLIERVLHPVPVKWLHGCALDGRHGR